MKPGDLLASKYRLEHVLGSGGMGEVWAAVNETTRRPVAVKLMHSPTRELRARMLREARAVGALKHRNIVEIYNVGDTESGDPFLVMERLSGETLEERLKRGGCLSAAKAAEIAGAIAAALEAAHEKGIVHRDLKPANVFLHRKAEGEGEIVKVLDFGVSKHLHENASTITAGLVGSPAYMSPEQARAEPNIDARSDLWSLGVVLFEMLAGRRPFASSSPYLVITEVIAGPIPCIAEVVPCLSPTLVHAVERCLTRDVGARVGSAAELLRLLGSRLDDGARGGRPAPSAPNPSLDAGPASGAEPSGRLGGMSPPSGPPAKDPAAWAPRPGFPDAGTTAPLGFGGEDTATTAVGHRASFASVPADAGTTAPLGFGGEDTATTAAGHRASFASVPADAGTTAPLGFGGEDTATTAVGHRASFGSIPADAGTTAPLVLAGKDAAPAAAGERPAAAPVPRRGPLKAVLAGAAALLVLGGLGAALRRARPAAETAIAGAASTEPPEAPKTAAPSMPPPAAATAAEVPASADSATLPPLGKDEAMIVVDAPEDTSVSLDGTPIGTVPVAPLVVAPGAHRLLFKHSTLGERAMAIEVEAGEIRLAATQLGKDAGAHSQARLPPHRDGEKRLVMP